MNPSISQQNLQFLFEGSNSIVYLYQTQEQASPRIIKLLKEEYPTPQQVMCLNNEYEISRTLTGKGIRRALERVQVDGMDGLVLEYFEGQPLDEFHSSDLVDLLEISIEIAKSLQNLHQQNVIHKDINSHNILLNPLNKQVRLIDFGISSQIDTKIQHLGNPHVLEGTLAYISPEQTGRMNRILDYRSDLYSLGVTLYRLFSGRLPFDKQEAMELVHNHIAKRPSPPHQFNAELPPVISEIILKLLQKNAEDRYQSAAGLATDLQHCLKQWQEKGDITPFLLAQEDNLGNFKIPQKLYGRESEQQQLLDVFQQTCQGNLEFLLVSGYSGVGKSALVHEVHKPMAAQRGYFIAGKYDQYQRNTPYSAISQAFAEFCDLLLTETPEALARWKKRILTALAQRGQILLDVIPALESILGKQPPVAEASSAEEAQNRFNQVFCDFMQAIAQAEHPLIWFLDDLQWTDSASLQLLQTLLLHPELQYVFIIGAYRDNEVDADHPLLRMLQHLNKQTRSFTTIKLDNLSQPDVVQLLSDSLHQTENIETLSDLIYDKTAGNAFFSIEFLKSLYQDQLLSFDFQQRCWHWELSQIQQKEMSSNVVELMANKIADLPKQCITSLKLAACIGNRFDLQTLASVQSCDLHSALQSLWPAVKVGLLLPLDDNYKLVQATVKTDGQHNAAFRFLHDRVQQAAYALNDETEKTTQHRHIGQLLLSVANTPERLDERLFEIVGHLNICAALLDTTQTLQLAELNLQAGHKAMSALAYSSAQEILSAGLSAIPSKQPWLTHFELNFALHNELALCEYRSGDLARAEQHFQNLMEHAQTPQQISKVFGEAVYLYSTMNHYDTAVDLTRKGLARLGMDMPVVIDNDVIMAEFGLVMQSLGERQVFDLLDAPAMTEASKIAPFGILTLAIPPTWLAQPPAFAWTVLQMVKLSHQHGNLSTSALGYGIYGLMLCGEPEQYALGYDYGRLSLEMNKRYPSLFVRGTVHFFFSNFVQHWCKHKKASIPLRQIAHQGCSESGAYVYGVYNVIFSFFQPFFSAQTLQDTQQEYRQYQPFVERVNDRDVSGVLRLLLQLGDSLQGFSATPNQLSAENFDEQAYVEELQQREYGNGLCYYYFTKQVLHFTAGEFEQALQAAEKLEDFYFFIRGLYQQSLFHFYRALSIIQLYPQFNAEQQTHYRTLLDTDTEKLCNWQTHCADNFAYQYFLVQAETARLDGQALETTAQLYEQAIAAAGENGAQIWAHLALANELCAQFWLSQALSGAAVHYLREAHHWYRLWGATQKVSALESHYQRYLQHHSSATGTSNGTLNHSLSSTRYTHTLDLQAVFQAASVFAEEIVLEQLLDKLIRILVKNAGAQRGVLMLDEQGELKIQASWLADSKETGVLQNTPIVQNTDLPQRLLQYVLRTREMLVLDDASLNSGYNNDSYIKGKQIKSIFCMPILHQNQLNGVLYLENNLVSGAFTPDRQEVLKLLSSQVAVSLENAFLYRTLENQVEQRTQELANANAEINTLNQQLQAENQRMGSELDVAQHLQQVVLPRKQELQQLSQLDVAACMRPADEIGGDYYDILQQDEHIKIGIGDVTGHGLESGLIMLMVQMAVRTLLSSGFTQPEHCLAILNHALYGNLQRMGSDRTLTLCLLDYHQGDLEISGQHEDILIIRANGQIEELDTFALGFFVGLCEDITPYIKKYKLHLDPGDGLVLYSDGITEAMDAERKLYGIQRLKNIVQQYAQDDATSIQEAIIEDVQSHLGGTKKRDDITLLVLKQRTCHGYQLKPT